MFELDRAQKAREELEQTFQRQHTEPRPPDSRRANPKPSAKTAWALALVALIDGGIAINFALQTQERMHPRSAMVAADSSASDQAMFAPIAGLSASRSQVTGVLDPATLTASYYWTFNLNNNTSLPHEACLRLQLPQNATVSRATLWVHGKAQEAAFNERHRVQAAYRNMTHVSPRHDPLLVTQTAPGQITLKAAPVLPHSGMQFRIGITTAGSLVNGTVRYALPSLIAANLETCATPSLHFSAKTAPVQGQDIANGQVSVRRAETFRKFATRATHSQPDTYLVGLIGTGQGLGEQLTLSRMKSLPADAKLLDDEEAAHRVNTLWAFGETERLATTSQSALAAMLATTYRVVSCVSGATVLESDDDYQRTGLDRAPDKVTSYEAGSNFIRPQANSAFVYPVDSSEVSYESHYGLNQGHGEESVWLAMSPVASSVRDTLQITFATVVNQLNSLSSYSASTSSTSASTSSTVDTSLLSSSDQTFIASDPEGASTLRLMGIFTGTAGVDIVDRLIHMAQPAASLDAGFRRNFSTTAMAAIGFNLLGILLVLTLAGPTRLLRVAVVNSTNQLRLAMLQFSTAIAWFALAIIFPDISQMLLLTALAYHLLQRLQRQDSPARQITNPAV